MLYWSQQLTKIIVRKLNKGEKSCQKQKQYRASAKRFKRTGSGGDLNVSMLIHLTASTEN